MTTAPNNPDRCAGRTEGWNLHAQCQNCQRKTTAGGARQSHFLPPVFIADKCPMRKQS